MNEELMKLMGEIKSGMEDIQTKQASAVDPEKFNEVMLAVNSLQTHIKQSGMIGMQTERKAAFEGQSLGRLWKLRILAESKANKEGKDVVGLAEELYGQKDNYFVEQVKSLQAGGNAGTLIEEQWFAEIIPLLYNKLSVVQLGARKVPMPNGNLTIRKMVSGSTANWIGESQPIGASQPKFGALRLLAKKLRVKVPYSNDLLRSTSVSAENIVLMDMVEQLRLAMDLTAYYGRGTEYEPLGIKNIRGITTLPTQTAVLDGDTMYGQYVEPLKEANIPMQSVGWAFPPKVFTLLYNERFDSGPYKYRDELQKGTFHGYPYVETNQIATRVDGADEYADVFFGDFAQFFIGEQVDLELETSKDASYLDEDGNTVNARDVDETVTYGLAICDMGAVYGKAFVYGEMKTK